MSSIQTSIATLIDDFANFGLHNDESTQASSELENLTNSLNTLSIKCTNSEDVDKLCAQVDNMCIGKDVDPSIPMIIKTIIKWQSLQCITDVVPFHMPTYGTCN